MLHKLCQYLQRILFYLLSSLLPFIIIANASEPMTNTELQRAYFTEARQALKNNDIQAFQHLRDQLVTYPLAPYLDIWYAYHALDHNDDDAIKNILARYHDIPETLDLRIAWIKNLAKRGQWPHVATQLKLINNVEQRLPKIALRSAWYNGNKESAFQLLSNQWSTGKDIHTYAIPFLYPAWKEAGFPHSNSSYARIIYFAKHGQWARIQPLQETLPHNEQEILAMWKSAQTKAKFDWHNVHKHLANNRLTYPLIKDLLRRLSATDIAASWQQLTAAKSYLSAKQFGYLQQKIALRAAKQHKILASTWLASLDTKFQNNKTRAWHVRILLLQHKWKQAIAAMQAMPESQQFTSRWLYWQAYALQTLNQNNAAKLLFEQVATGRGYYSFLSADHLQIPYHMDATPIKVSSLTNLKKQPYIQRCYEWLQLQKPNKASREWDHGLRNASPQTWLKAMQLSASWHWYERTIQAAARSGAYNALTLRFPLAYSDDVQHIAMQTGVQNTLIWSIIRQESIFNADAISRTGARGLMQLMPKTANYIAKKSALGRVHKQELFTPPINIRLGTLYLADLLKRFNHQPALAIAAYNAGPTRVKRWQKQISDKNMNIWVELIPFHETRRYVQQVIAFSKVYDWLLHQQPSKLVAHNTTP